MKEEEEGGGGKKGNCQLSEWACQWELTELLTD